MLEKKFIDIMLEAIDETLSCIGDRGKQLIYDHFEREFGFKKREIPNKIDEFSSALAGVFGASASILEIEIMKRLYAKTGNIVEWSESNQFDFAKFVALLRRSFLAQYERKSNIGFLLQLESETKTTTT